LPLPPGEGEPEPLPCTEGFGPGLREARPDAVGAGSDTDSSGPGCPALPEGAPAPDFFVVEPPAFAVAFPEPVGAAAVGASGSGAGCWGPVVFPAERTERPPGRDADDR
ncbi:hypothetical protein ACFCYA_36275, partial [Streptomyces virginiae]